jgi:hypothetical protein
MTNLTLATPFRAVPRPSQHSAAVRPFLDDDGDAALGEFEASEFAVQLVDARSEAEFDHLLGAILTHSAWRAGGSLPIALGRAIGGLLKSIARQGFSRRTTAGALGLDLEGFDRNKLELEAALRFVCLAAETARHAAEEPVIAPSRRRAQAAMAAASDIYAPPLLSAFAPCDRGAPGARVRQARVVTTRGTKRSAVQQSPISVWGEPFQYDPDIEYFLGDVFRSVGRVTRDVPRTASKVADTVGKIPALGDIARAGIGATRLALGLAAIAIDAGSRLARGGSLGAALKGAVGGQINAVRDQLKLAEMVAHPAARAAVDGAVALAQGKRLQEAAFAAAGRILPPRPMQPNFRLSKGLRTDRTFKMRPCRWPAQRVLRQVRANAALGSKFTKTKLAGKRSAPIAQPSSRGRGASRTLVRLPLEWRDGFRTRSCLQARYLLQIGLNLADTTFTLSDSFPICIRQLTGEFAARMSKTRLL